MRTTTWVICGVIAACGVGCGGADDSGEPGDEIAGSEGSATRWAAATTFELTRAAQDSTVPGFDLDGEVTPPGQGGPCPFTDRTDSEGRKGIDNQLAELTPILEAFVGGAVDGLIQGAVNEGRLLLLFEVVDDPPRVSVRRGDGKPYLGTDGLILDSQTFVLADEPPLVETEDVEIGADGRVEAAAPGLTLPVSILREDFDLHLQDVRIRLTPAADGTWTGLIGGGISVDTIVEVAYRASEYEGERMEGPMRNLADLAPVDGVCTRMSAALAIRAVPAYVFDEPAAAQESSSGP